MLFLFFVFILLPAIFSQKDIHPFDVFPVEYVQIFQIVYDSELSKQFLEIVNKTGNDPNEVYAEARFSYPTLEEKIRPITVNVQQKATYLSTNARNFLSTISHHVDVVLAGSVTQIRSHIRNIEKEWNQMNENDRRSYREQFPSSAIILDSRRYRSLLLEKRKRRKRRVLII